MLLLSLACRHPGPKTGSDVPTVSSSSSTEGAVVLSVSSYFGDKIHLFDPASGELIGVVRGIDGPQTVAVASDGRWVACAELENRVVVIDPVTFDVVDALVEDDPATEADETGGLRNPDAATFGPDGRLYVSSFETDQVLRYEADGTFVDVFIEAGAGGLDGPDLGLSFAPTGEWLVPGWYSDRIHRYDIDGEALGDLVSPEDGLDSPRAIRYDRDGNAWVSGFDSGTVLKVDLDSGDSTTIITQPGAAGLVLDEESGVAYLSNGVDNTVHAFDLATGVDLGVRVDNRAIAGATAVELLPVRAR